MKLSVLRQKLITSRDTYGLHRPLSVACLISFFYRLAFFFSDFGFDDSWKTPATIGLHLLLSLSTFTMHVPAIQRAESGITPEFRSLNAIFCCRSLGIMLLYWVESKYQIEESLYLGNFVIVLLTLIATDQIPRHYDRPRMDGYGGVFYNFIQIYGTAECIFGKREYIKMFGALGILQLSAFLMTLVRKNIITPGRSWVVYLGLLVFGYVLVCYWDIRTGTFFLVNTAGCTGTILRVFLGFNKYVIWILIGSAMHLARPSMKHPLWMPAFFVSAAILAYAANKKVNRSSNTTVGSKEEETSNGNCKQD